MAIGAFSSSVFSKEILLEMKMGDKVEFAGKNFNFVGVLEGSASNYVYRRGLFAVDGRMVTPESRIYPIERQDTTEAALYTQYFSDYYLVIGEKSGDEKYAVRIYFKPFISFLWIGAMLMFLAGMLRVGVLLLGKQLS
jgi:cytochrome c-type biogenesis protein CcmF